MWETLGIGATRDESAIRKAYAARLRVWRPETHPLEFSQLREAYEAALRSARMPEEAEFADTAPLLPAQEAPAAPKPYAIAEEMIAQLGRDFSEGGEAKGVETLRAQHARVTQGSVDDKLEWETVLLHSLISARMPPMVLIFEADQLLRWMDRLPDVARMFGDGAAQRLRLLLEMTYECMYARYFSPNRWHARLFGTRPASWFGATALLGAAARTAEYWGQLCRAGQLDEMMQVLDAKALRRVSGLVVLSSDLFWAALIVWAGCGLARDSVNPPGMLALAAGAVMSFVLLIGLPLAFRWARRNDAVKKFIAWWSWLSSVPGFIVVIVLLVLGVGAAVAAAPENPMWLRVPAIALLSSVGIGFLSLLGVALWVMVRWVEWILCAPWLWLLRAWGGLRFEHARRRLVAPTLAQQLKNLAPLAGQSWKAFRARRREKAEQRAVEKARGKPVFQGGGVGNWWWLWLLAWAAIQAMRMSH